MLALQVKSYKHNSKGGFDEYTMGLFDIKYDVCTTTEEGCAKVTGVLLDVNDFNNRRITIINKDYHICEIDVVTVVTKTTIVDVSCVERPDGEM